MGVVHHEQAEILGQREGGGALGGLGGVHTVHFHDEVGEQIGGRRGVHELGVLLGGDGAVGGGGDEFVFVARLGEGAADGGQ